MFGYIAEAVVFIERRGSAFRAGTGVLILLRELALGVVLAAGVDEAAEGVRGGGHEGLSVAVGDVLAQDATVGKRHRGGEVVAVAGVAVVNFSLRRAADALRGAIGVAQGNGRCSGGRGRDGFLCDGSLTFANFGMNRLQQEEGVIITVIRAQSTLIQEDILTLMQAR